MSGFPVPAKAKEAAARQIAKGRDPRAEWDDHWSRESQARFLSDAENALEAALPVLAEDPDDRLARHLYEKNLREMHFDGRWEDETEDHNDVWRFRARELLAALFGVASPSTKETETT